ncbi:MAG: hypothetical protein ABWX74_09105 [Aeromicrobium sp.]
MRPTILSRSLIAAASLAIASAALVAAPAQAASTSSAATSAGVTREMVLTLAAGMRTADESTYPVLLKAARGILNRACAVDPDIEALISVDEPTAVAVPGHADGVLVTGTIINFAADGGRQCAVGAVAAGAPDFTLQGSATLNAVISDDADATTPVVLTTALSADVSTTALLVPVGQELAGDPTFSASGSSVKVTKVTASKKVTDKKTRSEKKAAKKKYDKALKAAKKSYDKALKKAGGSKTKKSAAKKAHAAKKAAAKTAYKYAIANYKLVKKTTSSTDSRPFSIGTPLL